MKHLVETAGLEKAQILRLFELADAVPSVQLDLPIACSFEGTGTRTRSTFMTSILNLRCKCIELPPFLSTAERPQDLAGYLDNYYSLYIIRYRDHQRLAAFAQSTRKPVINAMSGDEHPCEALSDAYWCHRNLKSLDQSRVVLWGPTTNVLTSWYNVAGKMGAQVQRVQCPADVSQIQNAAPADVLITDGWPQGFDDQRLSLTLDHLRLLGNPCLIPTPPFTIGKEVAFDPLDYPRFAGYSQKACLIPVQSAIISLLAESVAAKLPR